PQRRAGRASEMRPWHCVDGKSLVRPGSYPSKKKTAQGRLGPETHPPIAESKPFGEEDRRDSVRQDQKTTQRERIKITHHEKESEVPRLATRCWRPKAI